MANYRTIQAQLNAATTADIYQNTTGAITGTAHQTHELNQNNTIFDTFVPYDGDNLRVVRTTGNAVSNGNVLKATYAAAKALTPNGSAISATNRVCVLIGAGVYDMGLSAFTLDAPFVDICGWGNREDVMVTSQVVATGSGTIRQTADNINLTGFTIQNTASTQVTFTADDPSAFAPQGTYAGSRYIDMRFDGAAGFGLRCGMSYAGYWERCEFGSFAMTGIGNPTYTISATVVNCNSGRSSYCGDAEFGAINVGGSLTGTFKYNTSGPGSFGNVTSATILSCSTTADGGTMAYGSFESTTDVSFTGLVQACTTDEPIGCFAMNALVSPQATGVVQDCVSNSGFIARSADAAASLITFKGCVAKQGGFLAITTASSNQSGVSFIDCHALNGGIIFQNDTFTDAGWNAATYLGCSMSGSVPDANGFIRFLGTAENCRFKMTGATNTLKVGAGARVLGCTVIAPGANAITSNSAISAAICHTRTNTAIAGSVTNSILTPLNVVDSDIS